MPVRGCLIVSKKPTKILFVGFPYSALWYSANKFIHTAWFFRKALFFSKWKEKRMVDEISLSSATVLLPILQLAWLVWMASLGSEGWHGSQSCLLLECWGNCSRVHNMETFFHICPREFLKRKVIYRTCSSSSCMQVTYGLCASTSPLAGSHQARWPNEANCPSPMGLQCPTTAVDLPQA